jgi:hypothetical protein
MVVLSIFTDDQAVDELFEDNPSKAKEAEIMLYHIDRHAFKKL